MYYENNVGKNTVAMISTKKIRTPAMYLWLSYSKYSIIHMISLSLLGPNLLT